MSVHNEESIRNAVRAAMSELTTDELRELVMDPYREFATVKASIAA